jgi:flagellar biosynthesis protein FlhG
MIHMPANTAGERPTAHATPALDRSKFVAIASGKGGVGKTWLAITLTHALARMGLKTLLFDGDLGLANVDIQLGLMPKRDLGAVLDGAIGLANAAMPYKTGGFDVIAGRSGSGALANLAPQRVAELRGALAATGNGYDRVLLDLGAGIDRNVCQLAQSAGVTLVVTNEEPTSLTDAYALIKILLAADPDHDVRIIVNMASNPRDGAQTYSTLLKACDSFLGFKPPLAGVVRRDPHVRESIRSQSPILCHAPNCDAARDVEGIAAALYRPGEPPPAGP